MSERDRSDALRDEIEKIEVALREPQTDERYCSLYGAQQALCWAIDPTGYASPYRTIQLGLVRPLPTSCIQEGSKDYLEGIRPPRFSNIHDRTG